MQSRISILEQRQKQSRTLGDFIAADVKARSIFPILPIGCRGRIPKEPDHEDIIRLSTPLKHLFSVICLTLTLPMIFVVLYYLVCTVTLFLKKGFSTIKFMCSSLKRGKGMPEQVTKSKDLEEECILMRAFSPNDAEESKYNDQSVQPKFKHHETKEDQERKNNNPAHSKFTPHTIQKYFPQLNLKTTRLTILMLSLVDICFQHLWTCHPTPKEGTSHPK